MMNISTRIKKILGVVGACVFLLTGCVSIEIYSWWDTKSALKEAPQYSDQVPITVEDIKHLLQDDINHYKMFVFYDLGCVGCEERMKVTAPIYQHVDTSLVKVYFIKSTCNHLDKNKDYLAQYGIAPTMYYMRDDTTQFAATRKNIDRFLYISRYLCGDESIDGDFSYSTTYIADREGRIKKAYIKYADGKSHLYPLNVLELDRPIPSLDFHLVDTLDLSAPHRICTPEDCY